MEFEYMFSGLTAHEVECNLRQIVDAALFQKYGNKPDKLIAKRIAEEWAAMERTNVVHDVAALYELAVWLKKNHHPYWMRGCAGSSFILYLLGITTGNPLPPHYCCPKCKSVQWQTSCKNGFDLPQDVSCLNDGTQLMSDGHDIPWQTLFGYGDLSPFFDIDLPSDLYEIVQSEWTSHWLKAIDPSNVPTNPYEGKRQCIKISKLSLMFHLERDEISHTFYNHEYTSADREYMLSEWNLFVNDETDFTNNLPEPDGIADLISLFGLSYSAGTWDEATACMIEEMGYSPADMIAYRDDVYRYLIDHGFLEKDAWRGMNRVRKGLDFPVITDEMRQARDKWVLDRCKRIEYLFPKAHAVENIMFRLKAAILPESTQRISAGYAVIGNTLDGIDRSDIIVLGARVAMGKTAFALDIAYALATTANKKIAIFTPTDNVKNILEGLKRRADTDCPENISLWTGDTLCTKSLRNKLNDNDVDFLIIDCLQSFEPVGTKSTKQVETTMQELKQLAKDKNVPMLILTQLSRKVERRKSHIPLVKDIPHFKSVVPFADSILLLYREAYYDYNADRSIAWCFIEKNARGGLGAMPLIWNDEKIGFENPAPSCHAE